VALTNFPPVLLACDAVLDRAHAARVRRHVATERRAVLARIHGVDESERRQRGIELVESHAGLHDRDVVLGVDLDDRVHPLECEHDPVRTRRARAREPGARTASRDGDAHLIADPEYGGDIGR
jgi:hypothetical protein